MDLTDVLLGAAAIVIGTVVGWLIAAALVGLVLLVGRLLR